MPKNVTNDDEATLLLSAKIDGPTQYEGMVVHDDRAYGTGLIDTAGLLSLPFK